MIAVGTSLLCEFHVRRNPAAAIADFPEDGETEHRAHHGEIEPACHPSPCSISFFQTYKLRRNPYRHIRGGFLPDNVFRRVKLNLTKYRSRIEIQKISATQDHPGSEIHPRYYQKKLELRCVLLFQQFPYVVATAVFDVVLSYRFRERLFMIAMTFHVIDRNPSDHSVGARQ